jgi:hypothetical protein
LGDKNGDIKPKDVFKSSHKKFWFDCNSCLHSFEKQLDSVKMENGVRSVLLKIM